MSATTVYGCDWCKEIVPKNRDDQPSFAMQVSVHDKHMGLDDRKEFDICSECRERLRSVMAGRVRRG